MKKHLARLLVLSFASFVLFARDGTDDVMKRAQSEMMSGNVELASNDYQLALKKARSKHDSMREFLCEEALAQVSEKQHDTGQEEKWLLTSLDTPDGSHKESVLLALIDLDQFYSRNHEKQKQIEILRRVAVVWTEMAGINAPGTARYYLELADVLLANNDFAAAEADARSARDVFLKNGRFMNCPKLVRSEL